MIVVLVVLGLVLILAAVLVARSKLSPKEQDRAMLALGVLFGVILYNIFK